MIAQRSDQFTQTVGDKYECKDMNIKKKKLKPLIQFCINTIGTNSNLNVKSIHANMYLNDEHEYETGYENLNVVRIKNKNVWKHG